MWRPEGWENPWKQYPEMCSPHVLDVVAFEMGADAMLEMIYKERISRQLQKGKIEPIGYGKLKTDITLEDVMCLLAGDIISTEV